MPDLLKPTGFWSYHRPDGTNSDGRMQRLHELLKSELYSLVDGEVDIFRDVETLRTGDAWEKEIHDAIDRSSFLIALVTPRFLQSEWCAREIRLFHEREKLLGRE